MSSMPRVPHLVPAVPLELAVRKTDGPYLFDTKGKRYIDFVMGWCVGNFGWDNRALKKQLPPYDGPDYVFPGHAHAPAEELARLLLSLAPRNLSRCFRATGGSEAVDIALQAAMLHTGRPGFLSLEGSYHGNCFGGLSVGASSMRGVLKNLLPHCFKIRPPLDGRALRQIESRLKSKKIAGFIMEPVPLSLGVLIPDRGFMRELQRLCRRYGTLLILDEVATGFGRTGRMFATEHHGLRPDLMCLAKAVTGGWHGLGAVLASAPVARSMEEKGSFYSTYGWHPRSVHAALAAVRYAARNEKKLLRNVRERSRQFEERLSRLAAKADADLRVKGLAIAIRFREAGRASRIADRCRKNGLLVGPEDPYLMLFPPLTLPRAVAEKGLAILEKCW
jgi:adenosylmethionine-8-amino-7-oxononanoate aminotransferase